MNPSSLWLCSTTSDVPVTMKVEDSDILFSNGDNVGNGNASSQLDFPGPKVKEEIYENSVDDLDHVVLKERQRMLLARYFMLTVDFLSLCWSYFSIYYLPSSVLFLKMPLEIDTY